MSGSNEQYDELQQYIQNRIDIENFRVHLRAFAAGSDYQRDFLVKRISLLFELYDAARAENDRLRAAKHEAIATAEAAITGSDSATTITPAERQIIREIAANSHRLSFRDKIHVKLKRLLDALEATEKKNAKLLALVAALDERKSAEEQFSKTLLIKQRCGRIIGMFSAFGDISNANRKVAQARRALEES